MNDETFGSSKLSNEDTIEEERKRVVRFSYCNIKHPCLSPLQSSILSHIALYAASLELMRKEQHKAMHGKKDGPDMLKQNPSDDIISQLQTSAVEANAKTKNEEFNGSLVCSYQQDTTKSSSVLLAPAAMPLVLPEFCKCTWTRNFSHSHLTSHMS